MTATPKPNWRRGSQFCDGPRAPLCREKRAQWRARFDMHRRAGRITDAHAYVAEALLKRLGKDGRCDPSYETLAHDSGKEVSTVGRALKRLAACGLLGWARRIVRIGQKVRQTSNAYHLTLGEAPSYPEFVAKCQLRMKPSSFKMKTSSFLSGAVSVPLAKLAFEGSVPTKTAKTAIVNGRLLDLGRTARPVVPGRVR